MIVRTSLVILAGLGLLASPPAVSPPGFAASASVPGKPASGVPRVSYDFAKGGMTVPAEVEVGGLRFKLRFGKEPDIGNLPLLVAVGGRKSDVKAITDISARLAMPTMPEMGTDSYVLSRDPLGQWVSAPLISMQGVWRIELVVARNAKATLRPAVEVDFAGAPPGTD